MHPYAQMLDEDARKEDRDHWYQPRCDHILAFLATLTSWIKDIENQEVENPPGQCEHAQAQSDVRSVASLKSCKSSASAASSSLRISAEAERAALMAQAAKFQEKHAIEEQEQILRKRRETLELHTQIPATTAKINYLKGAEIAMLNPVQPVAAPAVDQKPEFSAPAATHVKLDEKPLCLLLNESAPVVRGRAGATFQSPIFDFDEEQYQSFPVMQPEVSSQVQQWPRPNSVPPVITQA